jgi:hypothetical protein
MRRPRKATLGVVLAAVLFVLATAAPAFTAVHESAFVERATAPYHATVGCYDRRDWAALVTRNHPEFKGHESDVYGLWRYDVREVALPVKACRALERWRRTPAAVLGVWIFVLGHELTHVQQSDLYDAPRSRPFDEVEADCGGVAKFARIKHDLGITRRVRPPSRDFARCPAKSAVPR